MTDQIDSRIPPTADQILAWQKQDLANREKKRALKEKPTEFTRPPLPGRSGPGRARSEGSAFEPGRSNLPPNTFGYRQDGRNPEDIIIAREEKDRNI